MEVQELKKLIKENNIPNFLIFTGEEYEVQRQYIQQIAKVKKLSVYYADNIDEIWSSLNSTSLFDTNGLYVLYDDRQLLTNEKIYSQLTNIQRDNMLILTLSSVDKRLKMLKTYKDSIVEFNALKSDVLKRYIQKEIDLSDRNCEILMEICDYSYGHCLLEIDKIWQYVDGCVREYGKPCDVDIDGVFKSLLEDGTLYVPPRDTLWDFIKAFLQDKPKLAYELYQDLKELKAPTFSILSNLYNNTRAVLQVQICTSNDIAKTTGLTQWQIRNAKECVNRFTAGDLAYLMRLIQKVEVSIKQGNMDESIAIDYVFTSFY